MSADAIGGVWTYALDLARALSSRSIDTDIAVLGTAPTRAQLRAANSVSGVQVITTGLPLDWTAGSQSELNDVAAQLQAHARWSNADLVHLNAPSHAGLKRWNLPLVVAAHSCVATWWRATHHGALPADLAWRAERTHCGMAVADAVITPSRSFAQQLVAVYGGERRVSVVHNGRTPANVHSAGPRRCVLTAGRLWDPGKDAHSIDRAAARLGMPVYAAGPTRGPNGEEAALSHLVTLGNLGAQELRDWYARSAVFVSMSRYEPFGLSVLEAAQEGAALVLSDIETFRELWQGAACFVPPENDGALADAIEWVARNEAIRADLARRAHERAARYSLECMLAGTLSVYRHALSTHEHRAPSRSAA